MTNVYYLPQLGTNYLNVWVSLQTKPGLGLAVMKWVQVGMLMDSSGIPHCTVSSGADGLALPLVCLLIQAHQQALCAHKGPSVKLLCANWTATHAHCSPPHRPFLSYL